MQMTPVLATPPRRLFRIASGENPWKPLETGPDASFGVSALVLTSTRRGAFLAALSHGMAIAHLMVIACRCVDPRPLLDLRSSTALAASRRQTAESEQRPGNGTEPGEDLPEAFAAAIATGFTGIAYRVTIAPSQDSWAMRPDTALHLLGAPRRISPHDPDLVAVRRLWEGAP